MTGLSAIRIRRRFFRRLFDDTPEESLRLRVLVLMTVVWVALALYWLTRDPLVPGIAAAGAIGGHLISWRLRASPLGPRTWAIAVVLVALTVVYRDAANTALTGNRLPIAEYLALVTAVASFGLRTRGGLYGQLSLSGLVLFFVSERAFDPTFIGFLIVFTGLFLTFFAMEYMEDEIRIARVHWPEGQLGRFWFWLGIVGGGLFICSTLAFSLLPPDYRGRPGSQRVGIVPFMGRAASEIAGAAGSSAAGAGNQVLDEQRGFSVGDAPGLDQDALRELTASLPDTFQPPAESPDRRQVVMNVRSSVTSYWRGAVFDQFDGKTWFRSDDAIMEPAQSGVRNFYWQAYFVAEDQPDSLFVGYKPLRVIIPDDVREQGALLAGSTYSVFSQQQPLNAQNVRLERAGRVASAHRSLGGSSDEIATLAREIVGDAHTPFESMWRIVTELRQEHTFALTALNQLQLSGPIEDFLEKGTEGTSIDFASATVLLARAVGLPTRLAVGYLPGKFERFSGTHEVQRRHRHAWAEVNFRRFGWVSFDPSPRPEIERFLTGGDTAFPGGAFLLETRVGGGLYRYIRSGTSAASDAFTSALDGKGPAIRAGAAAFLAVLAVAGSAWWLVYWRPKQRAAQKLYSTLPGHERADFLKLYRKTDREMASSGLGLRRPAETVGEFADGVAMRFAYLADDLEWLKRAVSAAAYDPAWAPVDPGSSSERLSRLGTAARNLPPSPARG